MTSVSPEEEEWHLWHPLLPRHRQKRNWTHLRGSLGKKIWWCSYCHSVASRFGWDHGSQVTAVLTGLCKPARSDSLLFSSVTQQVLWASHWAEKTMEHCMWEYLTLVRLRWVTLCFCHFLAVRRDFFILFWALVSSSATQGLITISILGSWWALSRIMLRKSLA